MIFGSECVTLFSVRLQTVPAHVAVGIDLIRMQLITRSILSPGLPALLFFLTSARAQVDDTEVILH